MILVQIYGARSLLSDGDKISCGNLARWSSGGPLGLRWVCPAHSSPCRPTDRAGSSSVFRAALPTSGSVVDDSYSGSNSHPGRSHHGGQAARWIVESRPHCRFSGGCGCLLRLRGGPLQEGVRQSKLALAACGLVLLAVTVGAIPSSARLWNPVIAPGSVVVAWREVQQWAKANTPEDTKFLVPPVPGGFRVFSERVSWVEWKDGNIFSLFPRYADEWLRRMSAIGRLQPPLGSYQRMQSDTRNNPGHASQAWRERKKSTTSSNLKGTVCIPPVFTNDKFAVYRALN